MNQVSGEYFNKMGAALDVIRTATFDAKCLVPQAEKQLPRTRADAGAAAYEDFFHWHARSLDATLAVDHACRLLLAFDETTSRAALRAAEALETRLMQHEEQSQRMTARVLKVRVRQEEEREVFVRVCRRKWGRARQRRAADEAAEAAAAAAREAEARAERLGITAAARAARQQRDAAQTSPWRAVKDGCLVATLDALVEAERARRKHEQGRIVRGADGVVTGMSGVRFHVDDPDHATGETLLRNACWWGHEALAVHLLSAKHGADPNRIDASSNRTTPLHEAARGGHVDIARVLLGAGARRDCADSGGDTPLHWAMRCGHGRAMVEVLLGAEQHEAHGMTPLWLSVAARNHRGKQACDYANKRAVLKLLTAANAELPSRVAEQAEMDAMARHRRAQRREKAAARAGSAGKARAPVPADAPPASSLDFAADTLRQNMGFDVGAAAPDDGGGVVRKKKKGGSKKKVLPKLPPADDSGRGEE